MKFKKRGNVVTYAAQHPGALSAFFLAGVLARLSKGLLRRTKQLREASVVQWASQCAGLTEVRDIREVLTLAQVMDHVNRDELAQAMDVLAQRVIAIQTKRKGGSWEKAEALELIPSGSALATRSMLALTQ